MTLTPSLTPHERMAEIRRLTVLVETMAVDAGRLQEQTDTCLPGEHLYHAQMAMKAKTAWQEHDAAVVDLLEHLHQAEADGSLAECEEMLRVSHAGVL